MEQIKKEQQSNGSTESRTLTLVIEGKSYQWPQQYILGKEAKVLAGLPEDSELWLNLEEPWQDQKISDDEAIDLARPGIEQFFVKRPLHYILNGTHFTSNRQFIRGGYLRKQGNISANEQIYLIIKGPWEDELIEDQDWVDLARPGTEHFVSRPIDVKVCLIVNGREKEWNKKEISFREVVILAYNHYDESPNKVYTVIYKRGPIQNPEGSMVAGQIVRVKNKMIFNVTETTKS